MSNHQEGEMTFYNETEEKDLYDPNALLVDWEFRTVYITGTITDLLARDFNRALLKMEYDDPYSGIAVYINSKGGDVLAGMSMIDTMRTISCDVSTVCAGMAASMAAVILMCGEKGKRRIMPHSRVTIHQPLGGTAGQARDIEIYAAEMKRTKDELYSEMSFATGQSIKRIEVDCDRDYTMSASEALEYGIVDEIVGKHLNRECLNERQNDSEQTKQIGA